jgi:hypothetical protein
LPKAYWEQLSASDWLVMEEVDFKKMVKETPLERAKWAGFQRNLKHLKRDL